MADESFYAKWERIGRELRESKPSFVRAEEWDQVEAKFQQDYRTAELAHLRRVIENLEVMRLSDPSLREVIDVIQHFLSERERA